MAETDTTNLHIEKELTREELDALWPVGTRPAVTDEEVAVVQARLTALNKILRINNLPNKKQ